MNWLLSNWFPPSYTLLLCLVCMQEHCFDHHSAGNMITHSSQCFFFQTCLNTKRLPPPLSVLIHNGPDPAGSGSLSPWRQGWEGEWWCCWQNSSTKSTMCFTMCLGGCVGLPATNTEGDSTVKTIIVSSSTSTRGEYYEVTDKSNKQLVSISSVWVHIDWWFQLWRTECGRFCVSWMFSDIYIK